MDLKISTLLQTMLSSKSRGFFHEMEFSLGEGLAIALIMV